MKPKEAVENAHVRARRTREKGVTHIGLWKKMLRYLE